jgi:hypothetical protein
MMIMPSKQWESLNSVTCQKTSTFSTIVMRISNLAIEDILQIPYSLQDSVSGQQ